MNNRYFDKYSVSVVLPVYNECELIEKAVLKVRDFLKSNFRDFEIIVVESGSTDGTAEICKELKALENVEVIHEGGRNGIGSAIKVGIESFAKDLFLVVTADLPFKIETLIPALDFLETYDVVLSYRSMDTRVAIYRKLQSFIYNFLVKTVLGLKVKHVNSAFKLFKKEVIKNLPLESDIGFIDTEMVYRVTHNRISYWELPVPLIDRDTGTSTINSFTVLQFVKELGGFILKNRILRRGYIKKNG